MKKEVDTMEEKNDCQERQQLPWWQKYTLTLEEAAKYFGISYKKLRNQLQEASDFL